MKWAKLYLALICLAVIFSSCTPAQTTTTTQPTTAITQAPSETSTEPPTADDGVNPAGVLPIVNEKDTFTVYFVDYSSWIDLTDNNKALQYYEEQTNIHLDIIFGDLKVLLACGDYPEMIFSAGMTNQDILNYSSQGIILPLKDLIDKYGVMLKKAQAEYYPNLFEDITAPDGEIYGVPNVGSEYHTQTQKAYINVKWLEEANLSMPTTTSEFEVVLEAFKQRGDDIRPYTGAIKTNKGDCQYWLINPFIVCDFVNSFLYVDGNGKLQLSAIQPEFKEGLKWANSLYSKGLIDPGAFTQTLDQLSQLGNDPSGPKMGVFTAGHLQMGIDINNIELSKQYDVLPPLVGPNGKGYTNWWSNKPLPAPNG
jgi:putative aldouronate transport system substrate-binding protein